MLKKEKNRISRIKFFIRDFNSFEFKLFAFFVLFMVVTYMSCERHRNKGLKYLEKYQSEFAAYDNCVTFLEFISSNMENFFAYEYIKKMEIGRENLLLVSEMIFKEFNGLPQKKEKMQ